MAWAVPIAFGLAAVSMGISMLLIIYLELRVHALVQSGDLPEETLKFFQRRWSGGNYGYDLERLFSRRFKEVDSHARRLVPIVQIALVMTVLGFIAGAFLASRI